MNKITAKKIADICQAYSEGRKIQKFFNSKWNDIDELLDTDIVDAIWLYTENEDLLFRIAPEKKLVPFTIKDNQLFKDKWIKYKGKTFLKRVITVMSDRIVIFGNDNYNELDFISISYEKLLNDYEFEDGSPCGKYIEE